MSRAGTILKMKTNEANLSVANIGRDSLTDEEWRAFAIYIGIKAIGRKREFEHLKLNFETLTKALTEKGLIVKNKLRRDARDLWEKVFPNILPSQWHHVLAALKGEMGP